MPISRWAIILAPMNVGALRVLLQAGYRLEGSAGTDSSNELEVK